MCRLESFPFLITKWLPDQYRLTVCQKVFTKGACFKMEWEGFQKTIDQTTFKPKKINMGLLLPTARFCQDPQESLVHMQEKISWEIETSLADGCLKRAQERAFQAVYGILLAVKTAQSKIWSRTPGIHLSICRRRFPEHVKPFLTYSGLNGLGRGHFRPFTGFFWP